MLTIKNIERIRNYAKVEVRVQETDWAYVFWIENTFGSTHQITLSRVHPPQTFHPYRNYYCMTYDNHQMWLQKKDVLDCKKFLIKMTHFMAGMQLSKY